MSARNARFVLVPLAILLSLACGSAPPASSDSLDQALTSSSSASLGAASSFAILSAAPLGAGAVTCTGTKIIGDVGSSGQRAAVVQTENCTISGAIVAPVSSQVVNNFNSAYAALASQSCTQTINQAAFTGQAISIGPGVICFPAGVTFTDTTLTLAGTSTDTWLFKVGTSGTGALTGTGFSVVMAGNANPCNVTWWVAQAVTMTTSNFSGTILAGAAITATVGTAGSFNGRALAKAAVTFTGGTLNGCTGGSIGGGGGGDGDDDGEGDGDHDHHHKKHKCNQGIGNGPEGCDPGNSDHHNKSNDENDGHGRGRGH